MNNNGYGEVDENSLTYIGSISVDSGQIMIGDPCYLNEWDTNRGDEWNLQGKAGQYSYQGASATTLKNTHGTLGLARSVVCSSGFGDGIYPIYAVYDENGVVAQVIIDFMDNISLQKDEDLEDEDLEDEDLEDEDLEDGNE